MLGQTVWTVVCKGCCVPFLLDKLHKLIFAVSWRAPHKSRALYYH